jgi:putative DNA primase/helicase
VTWRNYDDVARQLADAGLLIDSDRGIEVGTARFVRCKVQGGGAEKRGWYKLHTVRMQTTGDDMIGGAFGIFHGTDANAQRIAWNREDRAQLTQDQIAANRARAIADRKAAEAELSRGWEAAASKAGAWWRGCVDSGENAYLVRKGLPAGRLYGARLSPSGNLVVPVQDARGKTWGLQVIYHDPAVKARKKRDKDFAPAGLLVKGNMHVIGSPMAGRVTLLCEGFATGTTLHEATGLPVIVAFSAGNLLPVAMAANKHYRGLKVLVCADDDYLQTCSACKAWTTVTDPECIDCGEPHGKSNAGQLAAAAAALSVSGAVLTPIFPGDRPTHYKGPTDFNDLHTHPDGSLSMVARQVESSLSALGWAVQTQTPIRAAVSEEGGGDCARAPMRGLYSLDEACERWTLLYGAGGAYFDEVEHRIIPKADVYALIPDHAARDWKLRPDRKVARIEEVGFDPTESDERVLCNLWGGFPTKPKAGDCQILLDLLQYLCSLESNSREAYDWALKWLAYPLQHHGAKMKTTLVFHGMQGAGKNIFFDAIARLYGEYGGTVDQSAVESQFNDWASRKLMIIFDEVVARADLYFLKNRIKSLITGDTIRINTKQVAAWQERNHCNGVWLSNELHPTAVELFDRRHFMIWTPPALSPSFYREVAACLANGGAAALHHHLINLDLGDFDDHAKPPMTDAKRAVQELSMGSIERFFRDWTTGETHYPVCACGSGQIYRAYVRWCTAGGEKPRSQNNLSGYLVKQTDWSIALKDVFETAHFSGALRRTRMVIPPEKVVTFDASDKSTVEYLKRPDRTEAQWATNCFFAFKHALGGDE